MARARRWRLARPSLALLLLLSACTAPAGAFVSGRDARRRVEDLLTEQLFVVKNVLESLQHHQQRLDGWSEAVGGVQTRLDALGSGQEAVESRVSGGLQRLESVSGSTAAARAELAAVATAQTSAAAALAALRDDLNASAAAVSDSVAGLASSQAGEHERTRGACGGGGAALSEPLAELQAAVGQATELTDRAEESLSGGLQRVESSLQETRQELAQLGQELREERQARLTTTSPRPTVDPQQAFLNSLYRSLSKRTDAAEQT